MRKNILFSTTRQWNPGDEFILLGCINLLKELYPGFNPVIYNRNPAIRQEKYSNLNFFRNTFWERVSCKSKGLSDAFLRMGFFDNSFKDNTDASFLDLAVFAGSPEWYGYRNAKLYDVINRY
ncbi:MAG: polysaccharide pyruvyl transferase family protein, partial [Endomicrobia bacterium]|nr:polysaccharide pyruvyl transferase family protein [Endomicrobiia bacterium]